MMSLEPGYLSRLLDDQFVWLSVAAWCVMLAWLWPRAMRQRALPWLVLAVGLHIAPLVGLAMRLLLPGTGDANGVPLLFWTLHALNGAVFGVIVWIGWALRRPVRHAAQPEAVLAERRRIASDLHDGVGSRLVALLATQDARSSEASELSMALQACLLELHMTVDALDDEPEATLAERLAHLRYRLQPAFDRLGIVLEWQVRNVVLAQPLSAEIAQGICRIVQEALSNALRHSHATRVQVLFSPQARTRGLVLEVRDNGRGFGLGVQGEVADYLGKGLRSMHTRALALHGELRILNVAPSGLCVRLLLPRHKLASPQRAAQVRSGL